MINTHQNQNSFANERLWSRIQTVGKIGTIYYSIVLGALAVLWVIGIAVVMWIHGLGPSTHVGPEFEKAIKDITDFEFNISIVLFITLTFLTVSIYRRFTREKLFTLTTVKLILATVVLGGIGTFYSDFVIDDNDPTTGAFRCLLGILNTIDYIIPGLAIAWIMKLAITLKSETDLTV